MNQLIRCVSGANLNLFRSAAMVVVLFTLGVGNAWGTSDYYASLKITQSGPTGAGSVYVANGSTKPGTANPGTAVKSAATTTKSGNVTMYWWVDINPGYNVSLSGKVTGGPYSAASASGNVSCAASGTADGTQAYTATATFVAVTVDDPSPEAVNLAPTDPSADYPFTVTFPTSNLKTIAIDLTKSPETATVGKFKDIAWSLDGSNVKVTGKFNGGGSYGGASRTNSTTVSLQSKASGSTEKTCTVTANFPALEFVSAEATEIFATQGESGKTGSATFTYNYGAEDDFPTDPTLTPVSGTGALAITGYTVTPDFSAGTCTVTVDYTYDTNNGVGDTETTLTLTAANGDARSVTIAGHSEAAATDDAKVIAADGETEIYTGDWATAWTKANTAANAGCTLYLLRNVGGLTAYQEVKNTFTLDLNGKILSGKRSGTLIYLNTTGKTLTIKDSKTGGKIQHINNEYAGTPVCVNVTKGSLILESGTLYCENQGASGRKAGGVICKAGTTFTMKGGKIDVWGYNGAYGVSQESDKNDNTIFNMNNGEITVLGYSDIYGISAAGKVNVKDGATINATATYSNCRGISLTASANATAANCYYGQLTMTGGTINSTCTANADGTRYAYGIVLEGSYTASMGTGVATDGSHANKAAAIGTIENATINVSTLGRYAYGVLANGSYQSKTNHYDVIQIKNTKIDVTSQYYYTYGVYANCGINSTNGGIYAANIELTNCDVTATTTKNHTAYAVWAVATATTIYKNAQPNYYGEYAGGATITVNSGTYTANTGTVYAYAIGTSARAKTTYDSESNVTAERKLGGNAEEYATLNIHGGTFRANAGSTTARAVSNEGNCTIDGGEFYATSGSTTADGIYTVSGKLKASGVKIEASATSTVYGVRVDAANVPYNTDAAWTGFNYAGDAELNNLDVTVTARTGATAYGVYLNAVSYQYTQSAFDTYMQGRIDAGKVTQANADIWAAVFPGNSSYAIAGKAVINGGTYKVTAATTTAHGIYSVNRAVAANKVTTAAPEMTVKNVTLDVKTNGTTTACGIRTGGLSTIDGANITVNTKTTTCYGMIISDVEPTTVTNTKIDAKGTATVYGIFVNASAPSTTNGYDWHGKAILGDGNDVIAKATAGNESYAVFLQANKAAVASGEFAGDYANGGEATITGGKYTATATGTTAYGIFLKAQTQQGDAFGRPKCTVEDGKFWGKATGGTDGAVNASGQIGYFTLAGGYYNVNTNLAKYKAEGKNILDVESGTPEYTEGYRHKITSELSGATVCKVYQGTTLKQSFATLEEALQFVNANTGTAYTIVMVADYTLKKGDYELPSNATLVIPNDVTRKEAMGTKPKREAVNSAVPVQLIMLTFETGVNMDVSGTIETTANQSAAGGGSAIAGATHGNYGRLHLAEGSTITLQSGANLNSWGYVTGKGEINALSGSTVREDFQLGYWRGGTATSSMLSNRNSWHAFPVTEYFVQNVEVPITFRPGSSLLGYSAVTTGSESTWYNPLTIHEADNVKLVGTSASMFLMETADASEDTYVRKEYDPATDRSIWTVNSGAKIGSFSFSLAGQTINSADYYLPISNNMTIFVNEGEFTITQDVLQIPGSIINISKLGKLTVSPGKKLFVMDNEDWPGFYKTDNTTFSRWYYNATYSPSWTTNPRTLVYPPATTRLPDAEIFVQGETEGSYYTSTSGANIHSTNDDAGKVKFIAAAGGNTSIQHVVNTENYRIQINFTTAQLKNELESPNEYTSSVGTVAGEAFIYMEKQWVKVLDGCLTTRTDGSGTHYYAKPSDAVEVVENGDNAYRDVATGARYFINAEKPLTNDECVWWEVEPVTSGTYAGDYMANQPKYDNYGAYYYYDATSGYWKPRYVTVTWKNQDGSTLATYTNVLCNTSPKYLSASPTWANTATEKHDWVGWRDAEGNIYDKNATLPLVQGNITYTAYYNTSKFQYTITFKNPDKTTIWSGLVEAGTIPICPVAPTQASTVSTDYTFTNWSGYAAGANLPEVTAAATYTAVYAPSDRKYTVTFLNYNAVDVLYSAEVAYNTRPVYPDDAVRPFRANTSAYSYNWTGWQQGATTYTTSATLPVVTGNISYIATFEHTELKYQVFFKRQDGTIIDAPFFSYEETPSAFPADPTMASTVSTDYTFRVWSPATLVPVTEDGKVYTALFDESPRQYTAHFVNYDGTSLNVDQTIDYNTVPAYTGATPFKPNDSRNSFEFSGWAWAAGDGWEAGSIGVGEAFPAVKGDITFTAQFTEIPLQFNVIYKRADGTVLKQEQLKWGQSATGFPSPVASYEDETYTYTFDHWNPAAVTNPVTADATYTAYFNQAIKTYSISNFGISPAGYGTVSPASLASVPHGSAVTVNSNKITVNGTTITATPTAADAQYTYEFDHWNNVPATVTDNVTNIEAVFTRSTNTYTVIWKNGDVTLETDENVAYGVTPHFDGETPTKAADAQYTYTFSGWSPAISSVEGNVTYTAQFGSTENKYDITWVDGNGATLKTEQVAYGTTPAYTGETPTKTATAQYTYTFNNTWSPAIVAVTEDATYTAQFGSTVNEYTITWVDGNGETLKTEQVAYGTTPAYTGATPTKTATAQYTYTFNNTWSPAIVAVTEDATYTATYTETARVYSVSLNTNEGTINSGNVENYTYSVGATLPTVVTRVGFDFAGWYDNSELTGDAVTEIPMDAIGDKEYWANWTVTQCTITWKNYDGTPLCDPTIVEWGGEPAYPSHLGTPTRGSDPNLTYTFKDWSPAIHAANGNETYTAQYYMSITTGEPGTYTVSGTEDAVVTTVQVSGALHVPEGNTLTTNDLIVEASSNGSGAIDGIERVTVTGDAYFDYEFDVDPWHWSAFGVPFEIDLDAAAPLKEKTSPLGIVGPDDYDIVYYDTEERAAHGASKNCWKYVDNETHRLIPGRLYMIAFDKHVGHVGVLRFKKAASAPVNYTTPVSLITTGPAGGNNNWNGIANPMMYHALLGAGVTECQVHDGGEIGKDGYYTYNMTDKKFFVGKAAFVQVPQGQDPVVVTPADDGQDPLHAPRRTKAVAADNRYDVQIASTDGAVADRLLILAEEDKADEYVIVSDLAKAGVSPVRAQMWVDRYGEKLCKNTTAYINNKANYPLVISTPTAGEYEIFINELPDNETTLYLTYNGKAIWNLNYSAYAANLEKGTTNSYGLRMVRVPKVGTGIEEATIQNGDAVRKVIVEDKVFIIRNGEMYSITGQKAQ